MISAAPVISFRNVYYAYPEAEEYALEDISFEVPAAGTEIILGGSGSGKSTILKLVLGLIKPESGSIQVDGIEITEMHERDLMAIRAKIGMVFQEGALFDSLTVAENVGFRLREHEGLTEEEFEEKVRAMLGFVELDEFYDRKVKLVLSAHASIADLYVGERLRHEFERTRSRLQEMQSEEYLHAPHKP